MKNRWNEPAVFELKVADGGRLFFNQVEDHQLQALRNTKHGRKGLYYKIPDDARGYKPFDCFFFKNASAYLVVLFWSNKKEFYMIDIDTWDQEVEKAEKKSFTEGDLNSIGTKYTLV